MAAPPSNTATQGRRPAQGNDQLKPYGQKMKAWLNMPTAQTYRDRLQAQLPMMAFVLRETWPDSCTDTAEERIIKTLAAEDVS